MRKKCFTLAMCARPNRTSFCSFSSQIVRRLGRPCDTEHLFPIPLSKKTRVRAFCFLNVSKPYLSMCIPCSPQIQPHQSARAFSKVDFSAWSRRSLKQIKKRATRSTIGSQCKYRFVRPCTCSVIDSFWSRWSFRHWQGHVSTARTCSKWRLKRQTQWQHSMLSHRY